MIARKRRKYSDRNICRCKDLRYAGEITYHVPGQDYIECHQPVFRFGARIASGVTYSLPVITLDHKCHLVFVAENHEWRIRFWTELRILEQSRPVLMLKADDDISRGSNCDPRLIEELSDGFLIRD